uniref:Uncharacterized protein n=1 Tax=Rhizophora mucronata TaxID=61149 RepID=A0A2P2PFQ7_RHIMU
MGASFLFEYLVPKSF